MSATSCHGFGHTAGAPGVCRCPSARGITITKARLSKNAPRRRYVLTVVGCLSILDCSFNFLFTFFELFRETPLLFYGPRESNCGVNVPVLVKSAEGCQAFFLFFFVFFGSWFSWVLASFGVFCNSWALIMSRPL